MSKSVASGIRRSRRGFRPTPGGGHGGRASRGVTSGAPPAARACVEPLEGRRLLTAVSWGTAISLAVPASSWRITNSGGTSNGLPTGGVANSTPGLNVADAALLLPSVRTDALDNGHNLYVNNSIYVAPDVVDVTGATLTSGPVTMSGLDVSMQYHVAGTTLRTLGTFFNPTAGAITAPVTWVYNVGSDAATFPWGTSSGDTTFTVDDRWIVTDDNTLSGDPAVTGVLYGPGSPASTPTSVSRTVFDFSGTQGVLAADYMVTVPAGQTRSLMFFTQLSMTTADALTGAAAFDANPDASSDLLAGLTAEQLSGVLNWTFAQPLSAGGPYTVSEGGSVALDGSGGVGTFSWDLDGDGVFETPGQDVVFSAAALDGPSTHTVTLRGTDSAGNTQDVQATVEVTNVAPTLSGLAVTESVGENELVHLTGTISDPSPLDSFTLTVDWGDGSVEAVPLAAGTTLFDVTHQYADEENSAGAPDASTSTVDWGDNWGDGSVDTSGDASDDVLLQPLSLAIDGSFSDLTVTQLPFFDSPDVEVQPYVEDDPYVPMEPHDEPGSTASNSYTVRVLGLSDDEGAAAPSPAEPFTGTVTVENVAPAVDAGADVSIDEAGTFSRTASFVDPGTLDTFTATVDYGDGSGPQPLDLNDDKSFLLGHAYAENGTYAVTVTVTDNDGGVGTDTVQVTVNNVAPAVNAGSDAAINEGATFSRVGSFGDVGVRDSFTATVDYGDGSGQHALALNADKSFLLAHAFADNGTYTVTVTVSDDDGGAGTDTMQVTVGNVAPVVDPVTAPLDPVAGGTLVNASATFRDAGSADTHTAVWDWGNGVTTAGTVSGTGGSRSVSGSHAYTDPGVYTVTLTVTDDDGASTQSVFKYVVVYDASAGFVTGGGWIDSPAGAYRANPTLTGRATFGFVAKHHKGSTVPTGSTEFSLKVGALSFKSTAYEWLVVSGNKAQYKGEGTVNGVAGYRFTVTMIDGTQSGGKDMFRIRIWNDSGVVYDTNPPGAGETDDPMTVLGGGSIVIHAK